MAYKYLLFKIGKGKVAEYNTVDELAEEYKWNRPSYWGNRETNFVAHYSIRGGSEFGFHSGLGSKDHAVLYDPWGRVVHPDYVYRKIDEAWNRYRNNRPRRYGRSDVPFEFRNGPVPHIHSHSRYRGDRHPKTQNEIRQNDLSQDNLELSDHSIRIKSRSCRNKHNLPNSWDDILHADWRDRSWKEYRKTQYKS